MTETDTIHCGHEHCGRWVAAEVIEKGTGSIRWLRCPSCGEGSVRAQTTVVYPVAPAGREIKSLPPDVETAWRDARMAHAVGAFTAAEMMCRKILMYVAADVVQSPAGKHFVDYIDDLDNGGYIPTGLKPVVDKVRTRGNVANHALTPSTGPEAEATLQITEHLLHGTYELPSI